MKRLTDLQSWARLDSALVLQGSTCNGSDEISGCRELVSLCFPDMGTSLDEFQGRDFLDQIIGHHELNDCLFLYIFNQNKGMVGFAILCAYHDAVYVSCLCVHPQWRRNGLGKQMLLHAQCLAFELHLPKVCGTVIGQQPHLVRYYSKLGAEVQRMGIGSDGGSYSGSTRFSKVIDETELGQNCVWRKKSTSSALLKQNKSRLRVVALGAALSICTMLASSVSRGESAAS